MKKVIALVLFMAVVLLPALSYARKSTYIVTNRRLNYVKLVEVNAGTAEERNMTHPVEITEQRMGEVLASIKLSKAHLLSDKIDTKEVFNQDAINYLAPALCRAFRQAQPNEEVQFSYVVKNPHFILRNDRLTMVDAWVSNGQLFLQFRKLFAKLTGDTDKRGNESKTVARARGLRVSLELGPGQQMASVGSDILMVDLSHDYTPVQAAQEEADQAAEGTARVSSKEVASSSTLSSGPVDDTTQRLEKLDMLRKRGLISSKEYKEKKAEILKGL